MSPDRNNGPIAREGIPFVLGALLAAVGVGALSHTLGFAALSWVALLLFSATFFTLWFFRNPERIAPDGESLVISPADGRVLAVEEVEDQQWGAGRTIKVSIFMAVFDVHVNRAPVTGQVVGRRYVAGKFLVASLDKASDQNERSGLTLVDGKGRRLTVVQIAGLVARRIVSYPVEGDKLVRGHRYGLIRFGSRVELYLPLGTQVQVAAGDRTRSGETVIGELPTCEDDDA